jgi:CRISPR-associated endonuclease Cas3-HD
MTYFGKPKQCYKCHIETVYNSWKKLYYQKENVIKDLCNQYAILPERFKIASLLTVAFHDAGKPSLSFQRAMKTIALKGQKPTSQVFCNKCETLIPFPSQSDKIDYRHEIIGGLALLCLGSKYDESDGKLETNGFPFEFFAAIGHHKPINPDSFRREWNEFFGDSNELSRIGYGEAQWNHVMEVARIIFENEGISLPNVTWKEVNKNSQTIIETIKEKIDAIPFEVQEAIDSAGETKVIGQIRGTLALLKSLLISADWEGSSNNQMHLTVNTSVDDFWRKVKEDIEQDGSKTFEIRDFQQDLTRLAGHGIAVAPTGSGKTEGAIAWALKNKKLDGKILYVLPNQVLTNSIYERLTKYFGEENVGLLHSSAPLYQILNRLETDEPEQYDPQEFKPTESEKEIHRLNRMMFRPIMVATVDQLLMTAFNGNKRWSVIMGEVMGGAIIFDEIHAYDGHMLALLERVTRELRDYSKMLFMSATMSKNLIDFLSKLLYIKGANHIIKDITLLQNARNEYRVNEKTLFEKEKISKKVVDEIEKYIENRYLFSWDEILKNDTGILIDFLWKSYNLDWLKTATIDKINDDTTINVSAEKNCISLSLDNEKSKVILIINKVRIDEFIVKTENGKLKIYEKGKRVAIVCNTVKAAQDAYKQFTNNNLQVKPMCLHSRFIAKDRRNKEKKLEKDKKKSRMDQSWPQILVATQVIECGMDIDYDVLYTEGAPLEAIIQRAGRVNRERSSKKGIVHVFQQDESSTRFYPPEITAKGLEILKEKSNSELTEEELINIIELVYKDKKFENDARFLNTRRVLDELIYDIGAVQDLPETDLHTRFVTYKMVEVVPEKFWDDIKEENQFVIMEHLVKMPLWAYLLAKSNSTNDRWKVMNMLYNDEIGGTFEDNIKKRLESKYEVLFA